MRLSSKAAFHNAHPIGIPVLLDNVILADTVLHRREAYGDLMAHLGAERPNIRYLQPL